MTSSLFHSSPAAGPMPSPGISGRTRSARPARTIATICTTFAGKTRTTRSQQGFSTTCIHHQKAGRPGMAQRHRGIPVHILTADEPVVRELTESLAKAWEMILNRYPDRHRGKTVKYMDAAMAAHNFHRLAIRHVIESSGMPAIDGLAFMHMMADTFTNSVNSDIDASAAKAEGVEEVHGG